MPSANAPAWAWWTERLTVGLIAVDAAAVAGGAAGLSGARTVIQVVGTMEVLGCLAAMVAMMPLYRRLKAAVPVKRAQRDGRRLKERLANGGLVEPAERPMIGQLTWSILATNVMLAWSQTIVTAEAAAKFFDDHGVFRWPQGWNAVLAVLTSLAVFTVVFTVKESAYWRRIAVDPALAEAPVAT